jgi:hypothetical protein
LAFVDVSVRPARSIRRRMFANERDAEGGGHRGGREVVRGRAEAAGRDDDARLLRETVQRLDDAIDVVVDDRVLRYLEADRRELGAEPGSVRVDQLSAGQLGPDRQDDARHGDGRG